MLRAVPADHIVTQCLHNEPRQQHRSIAALLSAVPAERIGGRTPAQGASIEATLWAEFADNHHAMLQEGKVAPCPFPSIAGHH